MHKTIFSRFLWVGGARVSTVGLGVILAVMLAFAAAGALLATAPVAEAQAAPIEAARSSPFLALRIIPGSVLLWRSRVTSPSSVRHLTTPPLGQTLAPPTCSALWYNLDSGGDADRCGLRVWRPVRNVRRHLLRWHWNSLGRRCALRRQPRRDGCRSSVRLHSYRHHVDAVAEGHYRAQSWYERPVWLLATIARSDALIGVPLDDTTGATGATGATGLSGSGSVTGFYRPEDWGFRSSLTAGASAGNFERFGTAVEMSALTAVVGAPDDDQYGSVYVFVRPDDAVSPWTLQARLSPVVAAKDSGSLWRCPGMSLSLATRVFPPFSVWVSCTPSSESAPYGRRGSHTSVQRTL